MTQSVDPALARRAETLVDEAVGQAAKGSYTEAAARAAQALAIDPDNATARELLESYRRLGSDDEERRRRRRSIAGAAATIEEMIEAGQLEEATNGTDALVLQYGDEAPVDELRTRIAQARAADLDLADLDAAIDAIRQPDPPASAATVPLDAVGTLSAEIEDHLRNGRLDEARGRLDQLAHLHGTEELLHKLRKRIDEARQVAEEHRREEEILIATAAIEDRIRRGSIDDAEARLTALAARHGTSAPVSELREQLKVARSQAEAKTAAAAPVEATVGPTTVAAVPDGEIAVPTFGGYGEEKVAGRGRSIAIAAVIAVILAGAGWWFYQRSTTVPGRSSAPGTALAPAGDSAASEDTAPLVATDDAGAAPLDLAAAPAGPSSEAPGQVPAQVAEQTSDAALSPPDSSAAAVAAPSTATSASAAAPTVGGDPAAPSVQATDLGAVSAPSASTSPAASDSSSPVSVPPSEAAADTPAGVTEIEVEALPISESPAPTEVPPAAIPASSEPLPVVESTAPITPPVTEAPQPSAVEPPPVPSAPAAVERAATGPVLLGCGDPSVVCVKVVSVPEPKYPAAARNRRLTAAVVVNALVDERGRVVETRVESGSFKFFNDAAIEAASRAVFQPATRAGVPGRSWARITFRFDQP